MELFMFVISLRSDFRILKIKDETFNQKIKIQQFQ